MREWLTAEEAAGYLGISMSNLYTLAQQGRIPGNRLGKMWRFSEHTLDEWVRANRPINDFFVSAEAEIEGNPYLRDPQREAYKAAEEFFARGGKRAVLQLPVGCGKTGLISILPLGIARGRALVIAPNLTIKEELSRALDVTNKRACFWNKCRVLSPATMAAGPYVALLGGQDANVHDCDNSHFVLTNIQQLASSADRWLPLFPENYFDMILVDEGHHNAAPSWKKVFERFREAKVVSLTATPFRSDAREVEGDLIYRYSFKRAMLKGYIKRLQAVYVAPEEIFFTYDGDDQHHTLAEVLELKEEEWFSRGVALSPICNKHIVDASLDRLEKLRSSGTHHQLIAVACSVSHAKAIRSLYGERGYEAAEIHSGMDEDKRTDVIQKLRSGMLDCVIQVQILGEGFDHPQLSVAAIFRPFRSLAPYVQFVGRIMRVIVQNDPRHPDNYGYVVTHVGLNLDQLVVGFREMDGEDKAFFRDLLDGKEPLLPPAEVLAGDARQKLREEMAVSNEIVSEFFEEDMVSPDDESLLQELVAQAEALGFSSEVIESLKDKARKDMRPVEAAPSFPVIPQRRRQEAKRRLNEEVKRTAKLLLNRLDLAMGGHELQFKYGLNITGNNFAASVQLVNRELNRMLGSESGKRATWKTEEFEKGMQVLTKALDTLTRRLKKTKEDQ
jgi:excisionase family DNA binding protein